MKDAESIIFTCAGVLLAAMFSIAAIVAVLF